MKAALPTFLSVNMKMPGNTPGGLEPSLLPKESFAMMGKMRMQDQSVAVIESTCSI